MFASSKCGSLHGWLSSSQSQYERMFDLFVTADIPNTDLYAFLRTKTYKESNTRIYPTEPFVQLVAQ